MLFVINDIALHVHIQEESLTNTLRITRIGTLIRTQPAGNSIAIAFCKLWVAAYTTVYATNQLVLAAGANTKSQQDNSTIPFHTTKNEAHLLLLLLLRGRKEFRLSEVELRRGA